MIRAGPPPKTRTTVPVMRGGRPECRSPRLRRSLPTATLLRQSRIDNVLPQPEPVEGWESLADILVRLLDGLAARMAR